MLVQPSVYGNDNQLHLDTLRYLRQQGYDYKGVAVVDADVSEQTLDELQEAGFCGVRMNLLFKGGIVPPEPPKLQPHPSRPHHSARPARCHPQR